MSSVVEELPPYSKTTNISKDKSLNDADNNDEGDGVMMYSQVSVHLSATCAKRVSR